MADVVAVFLVELVIGVVFEALAPEEDAVFQGQADALEEERILQAAKVFEVGVFAEGEV